jgi:hypothetical protein
MVDQLAEMRSRYLGKLIRFNSGIAGSGSSGAVGIVTAILTYGEKYPMYADESDRQTHQLTFDLTRAEDDHNPVRNYWLRPELIEVWGES